MAQKVEFEWNKAVSTIANEAIGGDQTLKFMANEWHRLYFDFVPADTMTLATDVDILVENGNGIIHHKVPYAHYQYVGNGFNFRRDKHALASARWDSAAKAAGKGAQLAQIMQIYVKRGG